MSGRGDHNAREVIGPAVEPVGGLRLHVQLAVGDAEGNR